MARKTFFPSGADQNTRVVPMDLFPDLHRIKTEQGQRNYIKERLTEFAESDALFLSDLFAQQQHIKRLAFEVIHGIWIDQSRDNSEARDQNPATTVMNFMVTVRALVPGKGIAWKIGRAPVGVLPSDLDQGGNRQPRLDDMWVADDEDEITLTAPEAWRLLVQQGKFRARAVKERQRQTKWKVEEIKPSSYDAYFGDGADDATKPKKKGRRTMTAAQAQAR